MNKNTINKFTNSYLLFQLRSLGLNIQVTPNNNNIIINKLLIDTRYYSKWFLSYIIHYIFLYIILYISYEKEYICIGYTQSLLQCYKYYCHPHFIDSKTETKVNQLSQS